MFNACFRKSYHWPLGVGLIAALLLPAAVRAESQQSSSYQSKAFEYQDSSGFDVKEGAPILSGAVKIRDLDYASYKNRYGRIKAYIVSPEGTGPFAGVLFFHWLGNTKSDRTEFLDEATELARDGAVSVLIQGFFPWKEEPVDGPTDRQRIIDQTIEVRRAVDLLVTQPGVDTARIGFVGHDYGAMFGAIVAGLEHRAKAYALMAGVGGFSDWSLKYWPNTAKKGEQTYRDAVSPLDPKNYVGGAAPASFLFQFSTHDKYIPRDQAEAFFQAASEPKMIKWYDVDHSLNTPAASDLRGSWLRQQLNLTTAHPAK